MDLLSRNAVSTSEAVPSADLICSEVENFSNTFVNTFSDNESQKRPRDPGRKSPFLQAMACLGEGKGRRVQTGKRQ